jgi:hypothetical protein
MTAKTYQQIIIEGITGLPTETLAEIADFVYFVRKRVLHPQIFEKELEDVSLKVELKLLNRIEETHLELEFDNYDQLYPCE